MVDSNSKNVLAEPTSLQGNVYLWRMVQESDITTIVPIATFQAHKDYITRVLLSPDVKHLATCSADHTAKVWNLDPEYPPARAAAESQSVTEVGSLKSTVNGSTSTIQRLSNDQPKVYRDSDSNGIVAEGTDASVSERSLGFRTKGSESINEADQDDDMDQSSQSNQSSFPTLESLPMDPTTNTLFLETTLAVHQRWVWDCAFSADSAYLVTVCSDHYARLWELASGHIIRQYSGHHRGAVCVALNDYSEPR
jgi:target of rapamycin complex subunit LST8